MIWIFLGVYFSFNGTETTKNKRKFEFLSVYTGAIGSVKGHPPRSSNIAGTSKNLDFKPFFEVANAF